MSERGDVQVDWHQSPRIILVDAPSAEITLQDLVDTIRAAEDDLINLDDPHIVEAAGKEDLGGGVAVGITVTLQNAYVAFEQRVTPSCSGTATTADSTGRYLIDSAATFQTDGVDPGDMVINFTDGSVGTVIRVDSEIQLFMFQLGGGTENDWDIGDSYKIYPVAQCNVSGGNLVAVDEAEASISAVMPTAGTQIVRTSSSSATLQELEAIQFSSYGGGVSVDVVNGQSGTAYPIGNQEYPVDNITDAVAIANDRGFDTLFIIGDITLDTGDNLEGFTVIGQNAVKTTVTINPGAQTLGCEFRDCTVQGTLDGDTLVECCKIGDLIYVEGCIKESMLVGTIILGGTDPTHFVKCTDGLPGLGVPTIDYNGSGRDLGIWGYHGGLKIENKTGADKTSVNLTTGRLILDSTVTAGEILVKGVGLLEDNSVGATVNTDGLVSPGAIADAVWDEVESDHVAAGTMGLALSLMRKIEKGRWKIDEATYQMIFYDDDDETPLLTFDLKDIDGVPAYDGIYERVPVP